MWVELYCTYSLPAQSATILVQYSLLAMADLLKGKEQEVVGTLATLCLYSSLAMEHGQGELQLTPIPTLRIAEASPFWPRFH